MDLADSKAGNQSIKQTNKIIFENIVILFGRFGRSGGFGGFSHCFEDPW